ncbi:MAG: hypothetical protein NUW01_02315 [Gemmatimonadaceae bacterium]|nr:hypothetical protein [Gemmatimonadaceae bacterium]
MTAPTAVKGVVIPRPLRDALWRDLADLAANPPSRETIARLSDRLFGGTS